MCGVPGTLQRAVQHCCLSLHILKYFRHRSGRNSFSGGLPQWHVPSGSSGLGDFHGLPVGFVCRQAGVWCVHVWAAMASEVRELGVRMDTSSISKGQVGTGGGDVS